ncbi:hypothetical protein [Pararhizobium sp.]|uniref:hypothetical protein n=1 Tax=Pararhizobium sp. TaxID=1977563 RepID=UPI002717B4F5|nr:hypothetical protein [Pararhizobium sp.]MDO9417280.1 hypothetical protein [Pararhizobium sp.]
MKIGESAGSLYIGASRSNAVVAPALTMPEDENGKRRQAPVITIASSGSTASLSSALWMAQADKMEAEGGSLEERLTSGSGAADEFMKWANMSMAEKIRAQILEAMGLSEDALKAMDADARAAIEDQIKEAIKTKLGVEDEANTAAKIADASSGG